MLTSPEDIEHRLQLGYDRNHYMSLYEQMHRAFGESWHSAYTPAGINGLIFPDWPDLKPNFQEIGTSQRILNTQFITLSRIMRSMPKPEFTNSVHDLEAQALQEFFLMRAEGNDDTDDGDWLTQITSAFMDGDGLGMGLVQVGLKTDKLTGYQYVDLQHVPIMQVLWDRNARSISRARWVCLMHYVPCDVAEAKWGKKKLKNYKHIMRENNIASPIECYRIFEYFDLGFGKGDPTYAVIPHDIGMTPLSVEANPFGCLPIAHYEHLMCPGMRRPIGRIALLTAGQASLNDWEKQIRAEAKRPGFDIVDPALLDPQQMKRVNDGESGVIVETLRPLQPGEKAFERVPAGEPGQGVMAAMDMAERDFTRVSGVNDFDQGLQSEKDRTLGENQLLDARSKVQSNWSVLQSALLFKRVVATVLRVAAVGDRNPITVTLMTPTGKRPVPLNDPDQPASSIERFIFGDPGVRKRLPAIVIAEQSLMKADAMQEKMQASMLLDKLAPMVMAGTIPAQWFTDEYLEALGYDPGEVSQAAQQQQGPAQPQDQKAAPKPPIEMISYKDAPPSIRAQMEQQAGMVPATLQERALTAIVPDAAKALVNHKEPPKPVVKAKGDK